MIQRPGGFSVLPDVVKNLIIINVLLFLATIAAGNVFGIDLRNMLGLHMPGSEAFRPYQIVTYMFMHGSFGHIFFNMFAVWMFGSSIENVWGPKRFLIFYILTGIGAAALHYGILYWEMRPELMMMQNYIQEPGLANLNALFENFRFNGSIIDRYGLRADFNDFKSAYQTLATDPTNGNALSQTSNFIASYKEAFKSAPNVVGASGSLFGILLAFGMMFPNTLLFLIFLPIPIKAKYFVIGYGLIELFSGLANNPNDNVAHFAHLGGMLFGYILIKFWKSRGVF